MRLRQIINEAPVMSSWIADLTLMNNSRDVVMALGDGKRYRINALGPSVYQQWIQAPSKGRFWHERVKQNYVATRLI